MTNSAYGVLVAEMEHDSFSAGIAGIWADANQDMEEAVWFDNFRVTALE
jgi:hypothetical protein